MTTLTSTPSAGQSESRASASTRHSGTASARVMKKSRSVTVAPCHSGATIESA